MNVKAELLKRNQRKLNNGELVTLAMAFAMKLKIDLNADFNVQQFVIQNKEKLLDVVYKFNEYTYISHEEVKFLQKTVEDFIHWRWMVATGTATPLLLSGRENTIDDLSTMPRYIDKTSLCSISDIYNEFNYTYALFKEAVELFAGI